jgi:hypothetical protein
MIVAELVAVESELRCLRVRHAALEMEAGMIHVVVRTG